jgi:2-polyprenyl-3-methyl-5-hydroxy-6-metoxy-1,4-benzoquinol methylase
MFGFNLPVPAALQADAREVEWTGAGFRVGSQRVPVLEYSENFAGWSDELTHLHEGAAGSAHPIDVASRRDACAQVGRWVKAQRPVILEIGCSSGFLLQDMSAQFPGARIMGADVVKAPLHALAQRMPHMPLLRFDLLKSPIPPGVLDGVVMLNVLEHIEDDAAALREVCRMLKPGGHVVLEVPAGAALYDDYDKALLHFRRYDMAELVARIKAAGLEPVRTTHLGFLVYPAFALVKRLNRRKSASSPPDAHGGAALVSRQAQQTSRSQLLTLALRLDGWLRDRIALPFGIRCVVVARRPVTADAQ